MNKRFSVSDKYGNTIYLSQERWEHIINDINHPEMDDYENHLKKTIQSGNRKQDSLNANKYRYVKPFVDLHDTNTHIIAIVLFRFTTDNLGELIQNNYIVTAYQKEIG